jgi:hypothetical protein
MMKGLRGIYLALALACAADARAPAMRPNTIAGAEYPI